MPHFVWRAVLAILGFASSEQQAAAKTPSSTTTTDYVGAGYADKRHDDHLAIGAIQIYLD